MHKRNFLFLILLLQTRYSFTEPCRLDLAKQWVRAYYEEGAYDQQLATILASALQKFVNPATHDKQIVIFDVDDVALSNYPYCKQHDFGSTVEIRTAFIATNYLPAIPAMKALYEHFRALGYKIVFLTSRPLAYYESTHRNLIAVGYTEFEQLILRSPEQERIKGAKYKEEARAQLVAEGYEIVCCIDDIQANLEGAHVGHALKIPNELYS